MATADAVAIFVDNQTGNWPRLNLKIRNAAPR